MMISIFNTKFHNNFNFKSVKFNNNSLKDTETEIFSIYDNKGMSYPYFYPEAENEISEEQEESPIISSTFRDEELFDEYNDYITPDYFRYDDNDIKPNRQFKNIIDFDYRMDRSEPLTSKMPDVYDYEEKKLPTETPMNFPTFPLQESINNFKKAVENRFSTTNLRNKMFEACTIQKNNNKKLSATLMNSFIQNNNSYSSSELIDIFNLSKLKESNGNERVDEDLLKSGYLALNSFPSNKNIKTKMILNLAKTYNENGDEIFSKDRYNLEMKLIDKGEKFNDLPVLMDTVISSKNDDVYIDDSSYAYVNLLRKRGIPTSTAADIVNATKLKKSNDVSHIDETLQNIAKNLLVKSYSPATVPVVISNLKVNDSEGNELVSNDAVNFLNSLVEKCNTDSDLIKYTTLCNKKDNNGNSYFHKNRAKAILHSQEKHN